MQREKKIYYYLCGVFVYYLKLVEAWALTDIEKNFRLIQIYKNVKSLKVLLVLHEK